MKAVIISCVAMAKETLHILDDIHGISRGDILSHLHDNAILSWSYVILLVVSTVICTLGLLLNSPSIVIGGMIISPLMWPLMKISAGISLAKKDYITHALGLLIVSILISLLSSYLITLASPLKVLSSEIMSRTQPTLLDVVVALSAGTAAALAVVKKKISSNLAGVAIATSLMPPLCVSGIGLALQSGDTSSGGMILFVANVISIIFIALIVFRTVGISTHKDEPLQKRGIIFVASMLILTALPLFIFLNQYSFKAMAYQKTEAIMTNAFLEISPLIYLENVKTELSKDPDTNTENIRIEADVLIPEDITLDFDQKESIINQLEQELQKNVVLNLRVQKSIALQSESDRVIKAMRTNITRTLRDEISRIDESLTVDSVNISRDSTTGWVVDVILRGDPAVVFTEKNRSLIEASMRSSTDVPLMLNIEIISRIQLQSQRELIVESIRSEIHSFFEEEYPESTLLELHVRKVEMQEQYEISILLVTPSRMRVSDAKLLQLKKYLGEVYDAEFRVNIDQIAKTELSF